MSPNSWRYRQRSSIKEIWYRPHNSYKLTLVRKVICSMLYHLCLALKTSCLLPQYTYIDIIQSRRMCIYSRIILKKKVFILFGDSWCGQSHLNRQLPDFNRSKGYGKRTALPIKDDNSVLTEEPNALSSWNLIWKGKRLVWHFLNQKPSLQRI